MSDLELVSIVGYIAQPGIDRNEYYDWNGKQIRILDVRLGLKNRNFPPGLVFRDRYGHTAIVRSDRRSLARMPEVV
ncbi:MAG: hypothetical protein QMD04_10635 [Anaerolineales bacterium]|nr:hypothetical protein [Anaerolineales bacterium]